MKEYRKYTLITAMFIFLLALIPGHVVFAGDINSNEAGLIAAASGTFSYDGKTYRAGSAYINSLTAYLSDDGVDLTAEQCSSAISQMYASVGDGVERGYLYEVGGTDNSTTETTESDTQDGKSKSEKDNKKHDSKDNTSSSGDNEDNSPGGSYSGSNADMDVWDSMSGQTEAKNKLQQRPEQNDADASVKLEEGSIVVETKDNNTISLNKKEQLIPDKVIYIIDAIMIVIFAISIICVLILIVSKCMVFKKPKSRHARPGHTKRRRIRRYTRNVMTVTTAASLIVIFILIGIYISVFNKNTIMQNMQSSGYFRYAYSEYISGVANEYKDKGIEALADTTIASYDEYLFTIKQNSMKILEGETDIRIPDSNVTPYIANVKKSYVELFKVTGTLALLSAFIGIIFMVYMDQSRERGVKHIAFAELIASAVVVVITVYMAFVKPYLHMYIEPDYLYLFIMECILWSVKVMTSISAFAVVLAMLLIGVYNSMKNKSES